MQQSVAEELPTNSGELKEKAHCPAPPGDRHLHNYEKKQRPLTASAAQRPLRQSGYIDRHALGCTGRGRYILHD